MTEQRNPADREPEINIPKIENEILELLDGDLKESALGFAAWLNANKMTPQLWFGPGFWRVPYGSDYLCGIVVGKDTIVFGRAFENTCFQFPVQFENPDGDTLEDIKKLIEYWKDASPSSDSWHVR